MHLYLSTARLCAACESSPSISRINSYSLCV